VAIAEYDNGGRISFVVIPEGRGDKAGQDLLLSCRGSLKHSRCPMMVGKGLQHHYHVSWPQWLISIRLQRLWLGRGSVEEALPIMMHQC
jgi:hypothetical protein